MHRLGKILWVVTQDIVSEVVYFFAVNMRYFANLISAATPYMMYFIGQNVVLKRGRFAVGRELFIPILIAVLVYYLRQIANRSGKGNSMPVPEKRFTEVDESTGEVTVLTARTEEMLLYVADLEDWFERRRML